MALLSCYSDLARPNFFCFNCMFVIYIYIYIRIFFLKQIKIQQLVLHVKTRTYQDPDSYAFPFVFQCETQLFNPTRNLYFA
jgi:hypothetical protein